jgi:uroporphyrin-3 C-methyltransferase
VTETAQALKPTKARGSALSWLAFLLALGAAGGAAYPFYLAQQGQSEVQKLEASLGAELGDLRQQARAQALALAAQGDALRLAEDALAEARAGQQALAAELAAQAQRAEADAGSLAAVRLAEVRYLSAVATQRLRLERDVPGSVRLLERADAVLAEADQASDISLRRALGAALGALRSAPRIDTVGLYLEVEQLAGLTDRLPLAAPVFRAEGPKVAEAPAPAPAGVGAWLWEKLSGLFRLRQTEVPSASPLLSEGAAPLLQHGLRLTLSQAQLALLRGDGALWRASLEAAAQRVEKYGRPSRDRSRLLERLGALAATPVAVEGEVVAAAQAALGTLNEALEARLGT